MRIPTSATGRRGRSRGFTLLELLAVITIAALVLGTSAAAMRDGGPSDVLIDPQARRVTRGDKVQNLPAAMQIEVLGSRELNRDGSGVIRFYPDGGSSGGHVTLSHSNGMAVQVQVDWLLGRVTLCRENCDRPENG